MRRARGLGEDGVDRLLGAEGAGVADTVRAVAVGWAVAGARATARGGGGGAGLPCASTIALSSSVETPNRIRESPNSPKIAINGTPRFHQLKDNCWSPVPPMLAPVSAPSPSGTLIVAPPTPCTW